MNEVAIIGIGMTSWGKWPDKNFLDHGKEAVKLALEDAGLEWRDIQFLVGGSTMYSGTRGVLDGSCVAEELGWPGIPIINHYNACATGGYSLDLARTRILAGACDIALCVAMDATPKGFFGPTETSDPKDLDILRFRIGITNPSYFAFYARRRMDLYGMTEVDMAKVKVKNSRNGLLNPRARFRKAYTVEDVLNSPMVSDPLRLLQLCSTSDGGAAVILASMDVAKKLTPNPIRLSAVSVMSPTYPDAPVINMPRVSTDSTVTGVPDMSYRKLVVDKAYAEAGIGPDDLSLAEVYDLSTAYELDWYEDLSLCKPGDAEKLLHDGQTEIGGKIPVNASGGLCSFGEAAPAQALAQVCEMVWQLRGAAGERQVKGANVGLACNFGLQGNASCIIVKK
jgi:acetyl-CoA acetyltransferase